MQDTWHPVYKTGCGWDRCPICGPRIEVEKEELHRAARAWPRRDLVSEWQAEDREGRPEPAGDEEMLTLKSTARKVRRETADKLRIKRVFSSEQTTHATELIDARIVRKSYDRVEWLAEVWLELLNPTITVARKEGDHKRTMGRPLGLPGRVESAARRAETRLDTERRKQVVTQPHDIKCE